MTKDESIFVIDPRLEEEKIKEIVEQGEILCLDPTHNWRSCDEWGKKRLAYEV